MVSVPGNASVRRLGAETKYHCFDVCQAIDAVEVESAIRSNQLRELDSEHDDASPIATKCSVDGGRIPHHEARAAGHIVPAPGRHAIPTLAASIGVRHAPDSVP